jgi:threonyl-tRNA synthetase
VQVQVLPVAEKHHEYATAVAGELRRQGVRVDISVANEALGKRIRASKQAKLPYVLVVGDEDVRDQTVGVNPRGGDVLRGVSLDAFVEQITAEIRTHS